MKTPLIYAIPYSINKPEILNIILKYNPDKDLHIPNLRNNTFQCTHLVVNDTIRFFLCLENHCATTFLNC